MGCVTICLLQQGRVFVRTYVVQFQLVLIHPMCMYGWSYLLVVVIGQTDVYPGIKVVSEGMYVCRPSEVYCTVIDT